MLTNKQKIPLLRAKKCQISTSSPNLLNQNRSYIMSINVYVPRVRANAQEHVLKTANFVNSHFADTVDQSEQSIVTVDQSELSIESAKCEL